MTRLLLDEISFEIDRMPPRYVVQSTSCSLLSYFSFFLHNASLPIARIIVFFFIFLLPLCTTLSHSTPLHASPPPIPLLLPIADSLSSPLFFLFLFLLPLCCTHVVMLCNDLCLEIGRVSHLCIWKRTLVQIVNGSSRA